MSDRRYILHTLKNIPTDNFLMTPLELKDYLNFEVKRAYFINEVKGSKTTGTHAHIDSEDELFIMLQGSCTAVLDDGHGFEDVKLVGPQHALRVPPYVWHGFKDMSDDAIIFALTSTNYDPERKGYCEDHDKFEQLLAEKGLK